MGFWEELSKPALTVWWETEEDEQECIPIKDKPKTILYNNRKKIVDAEWKLLE